MMKRMIPLLLALALLLCACGTSPAEPGKNEPAPGNESGGEEAPLSTPVEEQEEDELPILRDGERTPPALGDVEVTLDGTDSYLRLTLPEGWTWAQAGGTREGVVYGLWPEDDPDFKVELHYWPDKFGMCGTGVTLEDYTLPNGEKATLATEEIGDELSWFLILPASPDSFTIQFCVKTELYETHRAELELLLSTLRQGVLASPNAMPVQTVRE